MSKVFVSGFVENGIAKWGLFYEDGRGVKKHLTEDFKPLVFESENEAKRKLYYIETERHMIHYLLCFICGGRKVQELDTLYTHNAFQGVFQLAYNREEYSEQNTFAHVTNIIQNWIVKKYGEKHIPKIKKTFHWSKLSRNVDIIYDYENLFYRVCIVLK